jgi:hypothetical protein
MGGNLGAALIFLLGAAVLFAILIEETLKD